MTIFIPVYSIYKLFMVHYVKLKWSTLLGGAIASSLLLTACGGGSSSSESTPANSYSSSQSVQTALLSGTVISKVIVQIPSLVRQLVLISYQQR